MAGKRGSLPERGSWVHQIHGSNPPKYTYEPLQTSSDRNAVDVKIRDYKSDVVGWGHSHPPDDEWTRQYKPTNDYDDGNMKLSDHNSPGASRDSNDLRSLRKINEWAGKEPGKGVTAYLLTPDGQIKKFEDGAYKGAGEVLCGKP